MRQSKCLQVALLNLLPWYSSSMANQLSKHHLKKIVYVVHYLCVCI